MGEVIGLAADEEGPRHAVLRDSQFVAYLPEGFDERTALSRWGRRLIALHPDHPAQLLDSETGRWCTAIAELPAPSSSQT